MSDRKRSARILLQLWQRNSRVNHYYRMATGAVQDHKLKQALLKFATGRAQFSFELSQRIRTLDTENAIPEIKEPTGGAAITLNLAEENINRILRKSISAEKECFALYSHALTKINDGITREILIRHRARIISIIKELQQLDALLPLPGNNESIHTY